MQIYRAKTIVEQGGKVVLSDLPSPKGEKVEVVVRSSHAQEEEETWRRLSIESFFRDSSKKDVDYDAL